MNEKMKLPQQKIEQLIFLKRFLPKKMANLPRMLSGHLKIVMMGKKLIFLK